jgi:glycosyltransferase involved in cell wall biosynthesis
MTAGRSRADPGDSTGRRPRFRRQVYILCPGSTESAGGVGRVMQYLMSYCAAHDAAPPLNFINTRGPYHIAISPLSFLMALCRIVQHAIRQHILLLHINVCPRGSTVRKFIVVVLASFLRVRMVLHSHDGEGSVDRTYAALPRILRPGLRWMFGRADCVVVLGESCRCVLVDQLGVRPERVEVISNGVPQPSRMRNVQSREHDRVHILFLGRLGERKGVPELLAALATKRVAQLDWRVTLAGDGDREFYQTVAAGYGLAERVVFPGWVGKSDVDRLLSEADILVLPSSSEGLPLSVLEGLANGLAVICTPVGAIADYLVDQHSALLVEPGNVEALASALERLIVSPELRAQLGSEGSKVFLSRFTIDKMAQRFLQLYRRIGGDLLEPSEDSFAARELDAHT